MVPSTNRLSLLRTLGVAAFSLCFVSAWCATAQADTLSVSSLADDGSAGTLRAQITAANSGDTITIDVSGTITLGGSELLINKDLTLRGPSDATALTISANKKSRVLEVAAGKTVHLSHLTLTNGLGTGTQAGGGLLNAGTLSLDDVGIASNRTGFVSGAIGGGISNSGTLSVANSVITSNFAFGPGGGIWNSGTLTVQNSTIGSNEGAGGAGLYNTATAKTTISGSTLSTNASKFHHDGDNLIGGCIYNAGILNLSTSTLTANTTTDGGNGGAIASPPGSSTQIEACTLDSNKATYSGGAIINGGQMTILRSTLFHNSTVGGNGGAVWTSGTLTVNQSTIAGNNSGVGSSGGFYNGGKLTLGSNILSDNLFNDNSSLGATITSTGYNAITYTAWSPFYVLSPGDRISWFSDPPLVNTTGLQNNGGPTLTLALTPGSLAVNAGDPTVTTGTDQRGQGFARVRGGRMDAGALEVQDDAPAIVNVALSTDEDVRLPLSTSMFDGTFTDEGANPDQVQFVRIGSLPANGKLIYQSDPTTGFLVSINEIFPRTEIGKIVFIPDANWNGTTSFNYNSSDGYLYAPSDAQVNITVNPVDDAPVITPVTLTNGQQNVAYTPITFTATDIDAAPGDTNTWSVASGNSLPDGMSLSSSGVLSGTPTVAGTFTFSVQATNAGGASGTLPLSLTLRTGPSATLSLTPTVPKTNETLTAKATFANMEGTPTIAYEWSVGDTVKQSGSSASFDLSQPGYGDKGQVITCKITASSGVQVATQSTSTTVADSAPVPQNNSWTTPQMQSLSGQITATDPDGDPITYTLKGTSGMPVTAHGTVVIDPATGNFTFTYAPDFVGLTSFPFTVSDGELESPVATELITVTDVPEVPTDIKLGNDTVEENRTALVGYFTTVDPDAGNTFTYSLVSGDGDTGNAHFRTDRDRLFITSAGNYEVQNSYSIRVKSQDSTGLSVQKNFIIHITDVNDAPTATVKFSPAPPVTDSVITANAVGKDEDGDPVTFTYQWKKNNVVLNNEVGPTLDLGKPGMGDKGDTIAVVVTPNDGKVNGNAITSQIKIANATPVAPPLTFNGTENQMLRGQLVISDADGDALTCSIVRRSPYGTLTVKNDGSFTLMPMTNWNGNGIFAVQVIDPSGARTTTNYTFNIAAVNNPPIAVADIIKSNEDTTLNISATTLMKNDSNGEYVGEVDPISLVSVSPSANFPGVLMLNGDTQTIQFKPNANWSGTTSFTYTIKDSIGQTASAQVTLVIAPVNDAPTAQAVSGTTVSAAPLKLLLSGNDVDGDPITFAVNTAPTHGTAGMTIINGQRYLVYTSTRDFTGTERFTIVARDGKLLSTPVTATIQVTANHAPVAVSISPNSGSLLTGQAQTFTQTVRDDDGSNQLAAAYMLVSSSATSADARSGALLYFDATNNRFTLTKDDGVSNQPWAALGQTLSNSRLSVTLNAADIVRNSDGSLVLNWHVTFQMGYVGAKMVWGRADDTGGLHTAYIKHGQIILADPSGTSALTSHKSSASAS